MKLFLKENMQYGKLIFTLLIVTLLLTSCGTAEHRFFPSEGREDPAHPNYKFNVDGIYPATKIDVVVFKSLVKSSIEHTGDPEKDGSTYIPLIFIDFPISVVFDTLFLPYDLYNEAEEGKTSQELPR